MIKSLCRLPSLPVLLVLLASSAASGDKAPEAAASVPPLPRGWSEHLDPSSGNPYYYNSATRVTTWVRPGTTGPSAKAPEGCKDGACPSPSSYSGSNNEEPCGLWLGPSPIKQAENHGFGLGMFTGRSIKKGETIEGTFYGDNDSSDGEMVLALFGSSIIYRDQPPLSEYIWDEMNFPEVPVEYPHEETAMFVPGLAAIAPCTESNNNLEWASRGTAETARMRSDSRGIHRTTHATAGSIPYRTVSYVAVRDISPGEELTVECDDDNFDGGAYYLSRYNQSDNAVTCLDQNIRVESTDNMGRGAVAKRSLSEGSVIISTPVLPLHRREIVIDDHRINTKQQMLNYCFGHPDSDLLLMPFGPMANYFNHGDEPNAVIRWHKPKSEHETLERRLQYHHEELFERPTPEVAVTHGKTLVLDVVALRDIDPNEPVVIDYGKEWREAWKAHQASWNGTLYDQNYLPAVDYVKKGNNQKIRTVAEQVSNPYPKNIETFCFYHEPRSATSEYRGSDANTIYFRWDQTEEHLCFRPCTIIERAGGGSDGDGEERYTVQLSHYDNVRIIEFCVINSMYVITDVPAHVIRLVDRPYSTDEFLKESFRHEIGVPRDFYPAAWMRKKLRRKSKSKEDDNGEEFKRKKPSLLGPKPKRNDTSEIFA